MNKIIPLLAFSVILLVPTGIQQGYSLTQVSIELFGFSPNGLEIPPGETVEWKNNSAETVILSSSPPLFPLPVNLAPTEIFSHTFLNEEQFAISVGGASILDSMQLIVSTPPQEPISCGPKTTLNAQNQCVPNLNQICGQGTTPNFNTITCIVTNMGNTIGGTLLEINTISLLVGAIGTNPIITCLVGITIAGVAGQTAWFVHRRKKSENS